MIYVNEILEAQVDEVSTYKKESFFCATTFHGNLACFKKDTQLLWVKFELAKNCWEPIEESSVQNMVNNLVSSNSLIFDFNDDKTERASQSRTLRHVKRACEISKNHSLDIKGVNFSNCYVSFNGPKEPTIVLERNTLVHFTTSKK